MDFETLNEALKRWEDWELGEPFDASTLDVVLEAARAYRDLAEMGESLAAVSPYSVEETTEPCAACGNTTTEPKCGWCA